MKEEEDIPRLGLNRRRSVDVMNRLTRRRSVKEAADRLNRRRSVDEATTRTSGEPIATAFAVEKRESKRRPENRRGRPAEEEDLVEWARPYLTSKCKVVRIVDPRLHTQYLPEEAEVPESQRFDAANSLVYEANVRLRDPVYGCMGAISALQHQIQALQAELTAVRSDILKYKQREAVVTLIVPSNSQVAGFHNSGGVSVIAPQPQTPSLHPNLRQPILRLLHLLVFSLNQPQDH
ncbi:hypothetical protein F2Q69_00017750 [Brassica cretica]|uniref:LOB domain-containing protein n=1 Tax=Brassica cretica TaxID=69181 RepID=A0A8S9R3N6_BRACR|nr:hypothetical protein F2Q69_00017750 [Brassica cretica]